MTGGSGRKCRLYKDGGVAWKPTFPEEESRVASWYKKPGGRRGLITHRTYVNSSGSGRDMIWSRPRGWERHFTKEPGGSWLFPSFSYFSSFPCHPTSNPSGAADSLASRSTGMRSRGTLAQIPYSIGHVSMDRGSCFHRPDREDDNLYKKSLTLSRGARRWGISQSRALRGGWWVHQSLAVNPGAPGDPPVVLALCR